MHYFGSVISTVYLAFLGPKFLGTSRVGLDDWPLVVLVVVSMVAVVVMVDSLPQLEQDHRGVEAEEDDQRHGQPEDQHQHTALLQPGSGLHKASWLNVCPAVLKAVIFCLIF